MKKVIRNSRAQMQISFGMIFSILLIIVFVAFAFFGIKKFLEVQEKIVVKNFINNLNNDLEKMWKSSRGSQEAIYVLPKKIEEVCFRNDEKENIYFISEKKFEGGLLKYINYETTLGNKEKLCIPAKNREVFLIIKKDYSEELVTIESPIIQNKAISECTSKASLKCYNGNVYWYDSCNNRETRNQYCTSHQECVNGECIEINV